MTPNAESNSLEAMRVCIRELHMAGRLAEAIQLQVATINKTITLGQPQAEDFDRLGVMLFVAKDFPSAVVAFEQARRYQPAFPNLSLNLGLCLILTNRFHEALVELCQAFQESPDNLNVLDGLAHAYGKVDDLENARLYGEQSLLAKDRLSSTAISGWQLPNKEPPPFRSNHPQENVISFSLFGTQERYRRGAIKNAVVARNLYSGWHCRFYCDEAVPGPILTALIDAGAEVIRMPPPRRLSDGLFWRFLVADDPTVVRFLIRDCDSLINPRERGGVDEWLASNRYFHLMRDSPWHTDLILAGLWGGIARVLPPLPRLLEGFSYDLITGSRTADQLFLGRVVWPLIKDSVLIHDRVFRVFGAKDFPPGATLPAGRHVGDNDTAFG